MNKSELVAVVADKTGMTKIAASEAVKAVFDAITDALAAGDSVQMIGFGTFAVKAKPERTAHNPRTGETVKVAAKKAPVFKAGKALKDVVDK